MKKDNANDVIDEEGQCPGNWRCVGWPSRAPQPGRLTLSGFDFATVFLALIGYMIFSHI